MPDCIGDLFYIRYATVPLAACRDLMVRLDSAIRRMYMALLGKLITFIRRLILLVRIQIDARELAIRKPNTVWLPLRGSISEHETMRPGTFSLIPRRRTLLQLLSSVTSLSDQDRIKTVVLVIGSLGCGLARAQNIAAVIKKLREKGIKVIALLEDGGGTKEYLIALQADEIVLPPGQVLNLVGLRAEYILARGLLDKLAIEPEVLAMGKYKSAGEMLERKQLSRTARKMAEDLIEHTFQTLSSSLSERRGLKEADARDLLGRGPYRPEESKELGLIDSVLYPDELRKRLKDDGAKSIASQRILSMLQRPKAYRAMGNSQRLAIVYATGQILARSPGPFSDPVITPRSTVSILNQLRRNKNVKGVVLRVSSPGGSASASDAIWRAVRNLALKKPLIASFGDVAASGGYYIAMHAQSILAEPSTLTGSIGVVGGKLNFKGMYDKLGVNKESIVRGDHADLYSDVAGLSPKTREKLKSLLSGTYDEFVTKAADGRHKEPKELEKLAQGRVYTGGQALEAGLVDELGGLEQALIRLKELVGIPKDQTVLVAEFPRPKTPIEIIRGSQSDARILSMLPAEARRALHRLWCLTQDPIAALCLLDPPE